MIDKLRNLEHEISAERGEFRLFGLFLREDSPDKWDVVVAAPWFSQLKTDAIEFMSERIKAAIGRAGLLMISRIIALSESDRFLSAANDLVHVQHGLHEISSMELAGVSIARGYIIASESPGKKRA